MSRVTLLPVGVLLIAVSAAVVYRSAAEPFAPVFAGPGETPQPASWTVEVTYIANEGVLLAAGGTQVLIDGLFRQYETYPFLPPPHRDQLESATTPFSDIDLVLVSHVHGDHFHPESVARHLQANSAAQLVSSQQVVSAVRAQDGYATVASRVTTVTPAIGERVPMTVAGVPLEVIGLGHGTGRNREIQNLGHILTIGGKKFLHVGDVEPTAEIFGKLNLDEAGIDVAFLPTWFITGSADIVREHIRPKHIVVVHMSAVMPDRWLEALRSFPGAVAFTKLLEKRYY